MIGAETLIEWAAILVAGIIQYLKAQGVEVAPEEISKRVSVYLTLDEQTLKGIAERHLARFNEQAVDPEEPEEPPPELDDG